VEKTATTHSLHSDVEKLVDSGIPLSKAKEYVQIVDSIAIQAGRLAFNAHRGQRLIEASEKVRGADARAADDILRAIVVLMHASLEDFLRSVSAVHLRYASPDILNDVPLLHVEKERPEKFFLGALVEYRDMSVSDLIDRSVEKYLERTTYNSTRDIAGVLRAVGIPSDRYAPLFPELDKMISRRHYIVHRADLAKNASEDTNLNVISPKEVRMWVDTVQQFGRDVTNEVSAHRIIELINQDAPRFSSDIALSDQQASE